jgi:hypothetical protein
LREASRLLTAAGLAGLALVLEYYEPEAKA